MSILNITIIQSFIIKIYNFLYFVLNAFVHLLEHNTTDDLGFKYSVCGQNNKFFMVFSLNYVEKIGYPQHNWKITLRVKCTD